MARPGKMEGISIHSPHTRGDPEVCKHADEAPISIHSPHTRGDADGRRENGRVSHFNPLPSHEGRPDFALVQAHVLAISIHSPHTRGDILILSGYIFDQISIHSPHTRGDVFWCNTHKINMISIHSPHTRGDLFAFNCESRVFTISIHSPHTRGDPTAWSSGAIAIFQSTPLTRGETA